MILLIAGMMLVKERGGEMTLIKILFKFIEIILKFGCGFNGGVKIMHC